MAELFTKPQRKSNKVPNQESYTLFRGESNVHQLSLILNLKGAPNQDEIARISPSTKPVQIPASNLQEGLLSRLETGTPTEAVDLIQKLLCYAPQDRITAEQALKHEFFQQMSKSSSKATSASSHKRLRSETSCGATGSSSVQKTESELPAKRRKRDQQFGFVKDDKP